MSLCDPPQAENPAKQDSFLQIMYIFIVQIALYGKQNFAIYAHLYVLCALQQSPYPSQRHLYVNEIRNHICCHHICYFHIKIVPMVFIALQSVLQAIAFYASESATFIISVKLCSLSLAVVASPVFAESLIVSIARAFAL